MPNQIWRRCHAYCIFVYAADMVMIPFRNSEHNFWLRKINKWTSITFNFKQIKKKTIECLLCEVVWVSQPDFSNSISWWTEKNVYEYCVLFHANQCSHPQTMPVVYEAPGKPALSRATKSKDVTFRPSNHLAFSSCCFHMIIFFAPSSFELGNVYICVLGLHFFHGIFFLKIYSTFGAYTLHT